MYARTAPAARTPLNRALGVETEVSPRLRDAAGGAARPVPVVQRRRARLSDRTSAIAELLRERSAPEDTANALVAAALDYGSDDNCTALVLDVVALPAAGSGDISAAVMQLPVIPVPQGGETIDGFVLRALISDGRYSRLFAAEDEIEGGNVALKFPKPQIASVAAYHAAFVREAWVGSRVRNPSIGRVLELPPGRQTCLYTVMPLYVRRTLGNAAVAQPTAWVGGRTQHCRAAGARRGGLHRAGIIHRDIKPDNVILEGGGSLKLIDLGVVRVPGLEEFPPENTPGTMAYMAPEMFEGEAGNETTDVYALGITMFRAFTREFPYGNADAVSPARRNRPQALQRVAAGPSRLDRGGIGRAITLDPATRFRDMTEFAFEMEAGPARAPSGIGRPLTLYERAPVRVWQGIAALLALALLASWLMR